MIAITVEDSFLSNSRLFSVRTPSTDDDHRFDSSSLEERITIAANETYKFLSDKLGMPVGPWSDKCEEVCEELINHLGSDIGTEIIESFDPRTGDIHFFLILYVDGEPYLVDPTYQQFLSDDEQDFAQDVMIISLNDVFDETDLSEYLGNYGIDERKHHMWINAICHLTC